MPIALPSLYRGRRYSMLLLFVSVAIVMSMRAVDLQLTDHEFLQNHGDARYLRVVETPAHRGVISDRNGEPLAISTPVSSVWANPRKLALDETQWRQLAQWLATGVDDLKGLVTARQGRDFVYLRRQVEPDLAARITAARLPGIYVDREYHRYYPAGEVTAHVVGFTNVDDSGQEGIELAYNEALQGHPGSKQVIKDRLGRVVENVESLRAAVPGEDLTLSIDKRLQYIAYRELKAAVINHRAQAGSMVILDAQSGEVLAMVNQPSYNPNSRTSLQGALYRNRAVTDLYEPGSTLKAFTIAAALETGEFTPTTPIETGNGIFDIGPYKVRDTHPYGRLDVTGVVVKSSNIGAAKIALALEPETLWRMLSHVGFGAPTATGFPGEAAGKLSDYHHWREIEQATLAFGYGLSVSTLQLAQAYAALANDGIMMPASLVRAGQALHGEPVMSPTTAAQVRAMLEGVVRSGTGRLAHIPGYRVAGKTGTVHKTNTQGYEEDHYVALFAGMVPASQPRLVAVVIIDDPGDGEYFGGQIAAPVFSRVMQTALRLLNIPPDDPPGQNEQPLYTYVSTNSPDAFDDRGGQPER